jgi:hypothetical protein
LVRRKEKKNMSITLTTPVAFTIPGVTENDTIGAATSLMQDFQGMTYTAVYKIGTALTGTPLALNQGPVALTNGYVLTVIFNLNTGVWTYTYGPNSGGGTVSGTALATLQNTFIANRNAIEADVSEAGGLMPGTQVNWTAL